MQNTETKFGILSYPSGQILLTKNKICLDPSPHYSARPIRFET